MNSIPLVMHLVFRFTVGGLENGVVNLINHMDPAICKHMVVSLTECDDLFTRRIERPGVLFLSLNKKPGNGYKIYPQLFRLFKKYRPDILHTRSLAALEAVIPAFFAGIPIRIHGEHGWDVNDPGGSNPHYRRIRRLYKPFVHHYVALSEQIAFYLEREVKISTTRLSRICNGVDTTHFRSSDGSRMIMEDSPFNNPDLVIMGTVGRLQAIKDQITLIRAFAEARRRFGEEIEQLRLIIVGNGPLLDKIEKEIASNGLTAYVWLTGERSDISTLMQAFDFFVLPSRAEGISNTILEAMASGLAVVATNVGGNSELVIEGQTGALVQAEDPIAMASAIGRLTINTSQRQQQGKAARIRAEMKFSLDNMVNQYGSLYQSLTKHHY